MTSFPVRIRHALPAHRRNPKRFCRVCFVERPVVDQRNDGVLAGRCQGCHESKHNR